MLEAEYVMLTVQVIASHMLLIDNHDHLSQSTNVSLAFYNDKLDETVLANTSLTETVQINYPHLSNYAAGPSAQLHHHHQ